MAKKKSKDATANSFMSEQAYRGLAQRMRGFAERGPELEAVILSLARAGRMDDVKAEILRARRQRVRFKQSAAV